MTHSKPAAIMNATVSMATPVTLSSGTNAVTSPSRSTTADADEEPESEHKHREPNQPFMDWISITAALREKLTSETLDKTFVYLSIYIFVAYFVQMFFELKFRLQLQ